jgi:AcrR family transcriptional regulator
MSEARDSKGSSAPELRVLRDLGAVANLEGDPSEGLRERKKRLTRQQISDTATGMFLEHGFDEVRVADVAAACGVSEKTVYNYFPTKESLLLDREPEMIELVRRSLGADAPEGSPVDAFVDELSVSIAAMVRAGPRRPARPPRRRGASAGRPDRGRELPERRADPRGRPPLRRGGGASRVRLPV